MNRSLIAIFLVSLIGFMEIIGDIYLKFWSKGSIEFNKFIIIGTITYALIGIVYGFSLRYGLLSIINAMWQGLSLIFTFLLAVFYFNERPTYKQLFCIALIFVGTIGLIIL